MIRNRLGALLLALGSASFIALVVTSFDRLSLDAVGMLLGLATLHGALALGVLRDRAWSRWIGVGLSFFWVLATLVAVGIRPDVRWTFVLLHAPLPLLLLRPDELHPRTSLSLLITGAAIVPTVLLAWAATTTVGLWPVSLSGLFAIAGMVGLARGRTWGLLLIVGAGAALTVGAVSSDLLDGQGAELVMCVGLLLASAGLPFARPIARFLRG